MNTKIDRVDLLAIVLALAGFLVSIWITDQIFERIPHVEDEFAFLWQAEVMADGSISLPSPDESRSYLVPFVVDFEGQRFGKYPPGWPAALSLGSAVGAAWLVNPLLGGLSIWLIYRLGTRISGRRKLGLLAAGLAVVSPMFLMLSGSLMSHNLSLFLTAAFTLAWIDLFSERRNEAEGSRLANWLLTVVAGLTLGLLALTRPLTAVGVAIPFAVHGLYLFVRRGRTARFQLLAVGGLTLLVGGILLLWQAALTGNPMTNLYTLWWEYDRLGFGPGIGVKDSGHNLHWAFINTRFSLRAGQHDLFGWPYLSWLFLPFGLYALRRNRNGWLAFLTFPSLVLTYSLYWIGSWLFGPRYYYEALPGLAVTSAMGIAWLGGWLTGANPRWLKQRRLGTMALVTLLISLNLLYFLPARVGGMHGLYGMSRARMRPFTHSGLAPAIVIVHPQENWAEYGTLLSLTEPFSEAGWHIVYSRGPNADLNVARSQPELEIYHYYPQDPDSFYTERR